MDTPPLSILLEEDKASALLANFAQLFPHPFRLWLVDDLGCLVGYHPVAARDTDVEDLLPALERVRESGKLAFLPIGVAIPIWLRGRMVGALIVAVPDDYEPHRLAALQLLARVINLLAENRLTQQDLVQESLDRYSELNLLYRTGETMAASFDLNQVNRLVLEESSSLVQADEGAVMLRDRETGKLTVWASRGLDAVEEIGDGIPLGHEVAELVVRSGKMHIIERPELGARKKPLNAVLCVPLKTKDEVLGVLSVAHVDAERNFLPNDIGLINAIAAQAAVAIDNARMFSDLSALHAELEAANRGLSELNELKSSFLGVITHELRSPFADIGFSLQLIERYGTEAWSETQQEQWTQLRRGVREAKRMIDNLVSFAGLLSKQGDLHLTEADIPALVQDVVETLTPVGRSRRVKLSVDGVGGMPPIRADERRLMEALYHLVHNAVKYNRPGGTVHVRYRSDGASVTIEVQDTGAGIPAEKLKLLWNPFSQVADPLRRGKEGLGLGLALVRYVIHAHGGQVGVSSQEGVGSTFSFSVPVTGPARSIPPTKHEN